MPTPEEKWFLQFAAETEESELGRPWGDGTAIAARKQNNLNPWDEGCRVTSLMGGYAAMIAMRDQLKAAIQAANQSGLPFGQRGHVYFTDWRFNPLRDLSNNNVPFQPGVGTDPTALGLILQLMQAGIQVRGLFWLPATLEGWFADMGPHIAEHFWMAEIVHRENQRLLAQHPGLNVQIGIVGLDMRLPELFPQSASHHQKMMVIRVGNVNIAFCGGVDLAFTRRDAPDTTHPADPAHPKFLAGDWQSGSGIPRPTTAWPRQQGIDYSAVDAAPREDVQWASDLPAEIFGQRDQIWHDQHLMFEGPIVTTLENQFGERWRDSGTAFDLSNWYTRQHWKAGQVIFSTEKAFDPTTGSITPLDPSAIVAPLSGATSKVQLWRTIPLRINRQGNLFTRGEYTFMAGVAQAMKAATELIWVFDQYFWSCELARLINWALKDKPSLHVIIILPPHADTQPTITHHARRLAIEALVDGLTIQNGLGRVAVLDLWHPARKQGIYCHAKVQTYDGSLLVCGSGNLNRRSLACDSELDCAVLDPSIVANHQRGLWELLFPNVTWPNLNLNAAGKGAAFFTQFMQAANPANPNMFLIPDPWMPGRTRQLPTNPPTQLETDPNHLKFALMYDRVLDPNSFLFGPADERLDRWSETIEAPYSRWLFRRISL